MEQSCRTRGFAAPRLTSTRFTLLIAAALVGLYNGRFWSEAARAAYQPGPHDLLFLASLALFLVAAFNLLLSLTAFRLTLKPVAVLLVLTASPAAYFSAAYGVAFDHTMIRNLVETDAAEALELLTPELVLAIILLGLLPAALIVRARIDYRPLAAELAWRLGAALLSAAIAACSILAFYQDYAATFRNHRRLPHLIVPTAYLYAAAKFVGAAQAAPRAVRALGRDARRGVLGAGHDRPTLLVLVVGETARAQNFSLNHYPRPTNELLQREPVISFDNVHACGTSTAVSLPCMFSALRRAGYGDAAAKSQENLLDVLRHAGVRVLWRDNNSGCKGVCDRIERQPPSAFRSDALCGPEGCLDEALLNGLDAWLAGVDGDAVVVLHQLGSHGPAYFRRYPKRFERFAPVCASSAIQNCPRETIVNAYDNTIVYTDYFLAQVIAFLRSRAARFDTGMIYVSDHGESLGEHQLYLHGLPYFIAPEEQKRVPFILWLSQGLRASYGLDQACLRRRRSAPLSHDNLFHSVLGLLDVRTRIYQPDLDIFAGCRPDTVARGPDPAPS